MHDFFLSGNSRISYLLIASLLRNEFRQLRADLVQLVDLGRLAGRVKANVIGNGHKDVLVREGLRRGGLVFGIKLVAQLGDGLLRDCGAPSA